MSDNAPTVIHRGDYTPPAYRIDTVELHFDLVPERTVVSNRMRVQRAPGSADDAPLELVGEGLSLLSVKVDGVARDAELEEHGLRLKDLPAQFELEIVSSCAPASNTSLMGLYVSNGNFFTQCEAEGFRKITYFLDRPDVMATYTVTLVADRDAYPVLLSNGNLVEEGELDGGRHYAKWVDPFAKPCYLFALVAGKLVALEETIEIGDGSRKLLQVWVEPADLPKTRHAMDSLIASIRWDEARYGLPLDLDRFMIVAVGDFNMGAMENKGLNIFNTKYVLADQQSATDTDFANIEAVVGHEYFHNWTGNRVTCRDWFQLSLKEGLTVFRDQEFSADMAVADDPAAAASALAVKRIEDVRVLRQVQFAEDAGPMAHPVRPESYAEINNFYTVTVYEKGAEVVRMYQTLFGREGFRRGMDLYFSRHDGQAVTCDDFRRAMADANGRDLSQFERWYSQAGTPRVSVETAYDVTTRRYRLSLRQRYEQAAGTAPTPTEPLLIPFAFGLLDRDGQDLPLRLAGEAAGDAPSTRILEFTEAEQSFEFVDLPALDAAPVPSLLRHFSAPVIVEYDYSDEELSFLFAHDSDAFNRWEAGQRLATRALLEAASAIAAGAQPELAPSVLDAFGKVAAEESLAPAFRELALTLPSETFLAEQMDEADPAAVHAAREFVRGRLAVAHAEQWQKLVATHSVAGPYRPSAGDAGHRALKNLALSYLAELATPEALAAARRQYETADNMTERFAALSALVRIGGDAARDGLADFYRRFENDALVIDKWFALQAMQPNRGDRRTIDRVRELLRHPAFSLKNPNRARSLIFSFCSGNPSAFHAPDGSGYDFWAEQVLALDALNPQVAARLARALERWRKYTPTLRGAMQAALQRVADGARSRDVREVVGKAL